MSARLSWAVVGLVFCMTFAMVFATGAQIAQIGLPARWIFLLVSLAVVVAASVFAYGLLSPSSTPTPLHQALNDYAKCSTAASWHGRQPSR